MQLCPTVPGFDSRVTQQIFDLFCTFYFLALQVTVLYSVQIEHISPTFQHEFLTYSTSKMLLHLASKKSKKVSLRDGGRIKRETRICIMIYTGLVHRLSSPRRTEKEEQQNHITSYKQCHFSWKCVCVRVHVAHECCCCCISSKKVCHRPTTVSSGA